MAKKKKSAAGAGRKWSAAVMRRSIARSLKMSAEASHRRKASPFQSAMSMLNFEISRGGKGLSAARRRVLESAKAELRKVFNRPP